MNALGWIKTTITLVLFVCLGIARDFIFVNWNYQLNATLHNKTFTYAHSFFDFLTTWSFSTLYWSKWVLTALFCFANFIIGYIYFTKKPIKKQLTCIYIVVGIVAFIVFALTYFEVNNAYTLSREIIGFLQSPLPAILLYFVHRLIPEKSKN